MSLDIWLGTYVDTGGAQPYEVQIYDANYTHNVTPMWSKAGVYDALYNSDAVIAGTLCPILDKGVDHMQSNPFQYIPLNPKNGWGDYDSALSFLIKFRDACKEHPKAIVGLSK